MHLVHNNILYENWLFSFISFKFLMHVGLYPLDHAICII